MSWRAPATSRTTSWRATYQQYLRQATLHAANDRISNAIAALPIFPHYSFDLNALYGAVDGQKFGVERPTVKARYSRKYFGRGKGVVAYTLLCNHVPLNGYLIGAHEYEGAPRLRHLVSQHVGHRADRDHRRHAQHQQGQLRHPALVRAALRAALHRPGRAIEGAVLRRRSSAVREVSDPAGRPDRPASSSSDEKANIDQIVATLGLKEMTQGTLIRKLCTYTAPNPTRRAIFEFDKLIRSIYTLRYLRDPQLERNVHRSQNRIESYHQLRSAIAQVGGKKELTGRTDIEIEISNQCGQADRQRDHLLQLGHPVAAA